MRRHGAPIHEGTLSQVPKNVRNMRYYFWAHEGQLEMRFQFDEEEFIAWAEGLGWTYDAILDNHRGGSVLLYDTDSKDGSEVFGFSTGYSLTSYGPMENQTHGISENFQVRRISYDEASHTVYLQLWTPLPAKLKNGLEVQRIR